MFRAYLIVNSQSVATAHGSLSRLGVLRDLHSMVEKKLGQTLRAPLYQGL